MQIGASILGFNSCKDIKISRSLHLCEDTGPNEIVSGRFETTLCGTIRHLGMVENNEITGKRVRDTIRVRATSPIFTATPQENAEEDIVHYDGALWRVITSRKNASTWVATAVRTKGKQEFCEDVTKPSAAQPSTTII